MRRVLVAAVVVAWIVVVVTALAVPAHAAGKPVPRKVNVCQAAQLHGTYRWQCHRPTLRPSAWEIAGWLR